MWKLITVATFILLMKNVSTRPVNEPTKITLDSNNNTTEKPGVILSTLQQGEEVASEAQNNVASILFANSNVVKPRSVTSQPSYETAPFAQFLPPKTREAVRLEEPAGQGFLEKPVNHPVETVLLNFLHPTPIVDGIQEHEKYGNSGDRFANIGRALVNGFEGLSNLLNNIVDVPVNVARKTSSGITDALNQLGSKIIGLQ